MNIMPNANLIVKKPSHKKRNITVLVIIIVLLLILALVLYSFYFSPKAKTASLNKKMENTAFQIAAIPNLNSKENVDKFNKLVDEFQSARKQQEKLLKSQLDVLK